MVPATIPMAQKTVVSNTPRKLVRWHEGLVTFITKEAKHLKSDHKTVIKVYVEKDGKKERVVIEKIGRV